MSHPPKNDSLCLHHKNGMTTFFHLYFKNKNSVAHEFLRGWWPIKPKDPPLGAFSGRVLQMGAPISSGATCSLDGPTFSLHHCSFWLQIEIDLLLVRRLLPSLLDQVMLTPPQTCAAPLNASYFQLQIWRGVSPASPVRLTDRWWAPGVLRVAEQCCQREQQPVSVFLYSQ